MIQRRDLEHPYLRIGTDWGSAVFAGVGKQRLVTLDTERLLVSEDVTISSQVQVTVETGEKRRICRLLGHLFNQQYVICTSTVYQV